MMYVSPVPSSLPCVFLFNVYGTVLNIEFIPVILYVEANSPGCLEMQSRFLKEILKRDPTVLNLLSLLVGLLVSQDFPTDAQEGKLTH